ncbi:hypothetical protein EBU71_09365 [bacterium]|nr:hypothetical protein [Candidatus Elulimicrobium humile]
MIKNQIIALSGGFDIIHPGHIRMIKGAQNFGRVLIILNSDSWLMKKKGLVMMPWHERKEILLAIKGIDFVESVDDHDGTVCEALKRLKPNIFGNGGIRGQKNTPERQICNELGIACVWGIGGGEQDVYSNDILEKIYSAKRPNI